MFSFDLKVALYIPRDGFIYCDWAPFINKATAIESIFYFYWVREKTGHFTSKASGQDATRGRRRTMPISIFNKYAPSRHSSLLYDNSPQFRTLYNCDWIFKIYNYSLEKLRIKKFNFFFLHVLLLATNKTRFELPCHIHNRNQNSCGKWERDTVSVFTSQRSLQDAVPTPTISTRGLTKNSKHFHSLCPPDRDIMTSNARNFSRKWYFANLTYHAPFLPDLQKSLDNGTLSNPTDLLTTETTLTPPHLPHRY